MRHRLWMSLAVLTFLLLGSAAATALPVAAAGSDWTAYQHDAAGSGFNGGESTLSASNAGTLRASWVAHGGGPGMSAQALSVGNVVYWGSWDGMFHATRLSAPGAGTNLWTRNLGQTHVTGCGPGTAALAGTPAFGSIGGTPTLYVADGGNNAAGGGSVVLSALNATTGTTEWQTGLSPVAPDNFAWSSPVLSGGSVYYSIASLADCPVVNGRVIKVNATTGTIEGSASIGAGVWGTPTIDPATNMMYVPVGAPSHSGGFSDSLVEVNASSMTIVAHWTVPPSQTLSDGDFGSVPTLFSAGTRQLVGLGNKNGIFYAWDRTNIAAGPVWERQVAIGGNGPQGGAGTLSPAVWDGSTLYVAGSRTTIGGAACGGGVRALDPATGTSKWEFCASGHILGPLAGSPGLIAVGAGSSVIVLNSATGAQLFRYNEPGGGLFWAGPSIGNGHIFAGNMDASLTALGLPGTTGSPSINLAPPSQNAVVGSTETVTATVTDASGSPLSGVTTNFSVTSGPNAGQTGSGVTDASGQATFSVTSSTVGDDVIQASFTDSSGTTHTSNSVTASFTPVAVPNIALAPPSQSGPLGSTQTVTARVVDPAGNPLAGVTVSFRVTSGPNGGQTGTGVTAVNGQTTFSVTSSTAGTDSIQASFVDSSGTTRTSNAVTVAFTTGAVISNLSVKDTANAAHWSIQQNVQVGNLIYGDRTYRFATLPASLAGSAWIQTANSSKTFTGNPLVTFTLGQQAGVFVGMDRRAGRPAWLDATWTDTHMTETGAGVTYEVFQKTFPAGTVSLGPNGGTGTGRSCYTIIVH